MLITESFSSKEEAQEAWNYGVTRCQYVTSDMFNKKNNKSEHLNPIQDDYIDFPRAESAFCQYIIHKDGVMTHQWPKVYPEYFYLYEKNFIQDDILKIYLLRSRWFIIDKDYCNIKKIISKEILNNDENNNRINDF